MTVVLTESWPENCSGNIDLQNLTAAGINVVNEIIIAQLGEFSRSDWLAKRSIQGEISSRKRG